MQHADGDRSRRRVAQRRHRAVGGERHVTVSGRVLRALSDGAAGHRRHAAGHGQRQVGGNEAEQLSVFASAQLHCRWL